jgi:hypothetical protein
VGAPGPNVDSSILGRYQKSRLEPGWHVLGFGLGLRIQNELVLPIRADLDAARIECHVYSYKIHE